MPASLISLENGTLLLLDKPIMLIGRHEECDIQLDSRKISRRHCCIAQVNGSLLIRDLGSTNGIRVNGTQLEESPLKHGDELTIGNLRFRIEADGSSGDGARDKGLTLNSSASGELPVPAEESND